MENKKDNKRVKLMTIHTSKGSEHACVFIAGLEKKLLPNKRSSIEEERRLFYVAMTRAERRLFLSYCHYRKIFGKPIAVKPSPFLKEIPDEHLEGMKILTV